jgi:O-glycosyl hydrolase
LAIPALAQEHRETLRISVDPHRRFQTIEGFGVNVIGPWFRDEQKPMFDMLIDDLGATRFRVGAYLVYSNWEDINMHENPELAAHGLSANWEYWDNRYSSPIFEPSWALMRHLNSRGIRPLVALYGPVPDWMTDDKVGPLDKAVSLDKLYKKRQNHLSAKMYDAFAEEVVSMLAYARNQAHVDFTYFSPFNETDAYPTEGPRIDPGEAPNVLDAVARRLKKDGLADVKLAVADQADPTKNFISPILEDTELMKQVGALTLHIYRDTDAVASHAEHIRKSKFPHTPLWVTEYGELDDLNRTAENEWAGFSVAAGQRALRTLNQGASVLMIWDAFDDYEDCVKRLCY